MVGPEVAAGRHRAQRYREPFGLGDAGIEHEGLASADLLYRTQQLLGIHNVAAPFIVKRLGQQVVVDSTEMITLKSQMMPLSIASGVAFMNRRLRMLSVGWSRPAKLLRRPASPAVLCASSKMPKSNVYPWGRLAARVGALA